jgi:hypothetical protein
MSSKSIEQILNYKTLLGVINDPQGGVPTDLLPSALFGFTRRVEGVTGSYTRIKSTRRSATVVPYGSPSVRVNQQDVSEIPVRLLHTNEHIMHHATVLAQLRNFDNYEMQNLGSQLVAYQTAEFRRRFDNLRTNVVAQLLGLGNSYLTASGGLLNSSSGAAITVPGGVPAGNQGDLGGIIAASWATAGTSIASQIENLKVAARKASGLPIRHCLYGKKIFQYLLNNTELKNVINGDSGTSGAFTRREIPDGFLGLKWWPMYEQFMVDANGVDQDIFGDDKAVFIPDPSSDWFEILEGTAPVPTRLNISGDGSAALNDFAMIQGKYSYATIETDAPGIKHVAGDTFLPVLKIPSSIWIADVTP